MTEDDQFPLPESVKVLVSRICAEQNQPPISKQSRKSLASLEEGIAISILKKIAGRPIKSSFNGFISYLIKEHQSMQASNGTSTPNSSAAKTPSLYSPDSPYSYSPRKRHAGMLSPTSSVPTRLCFEYEIKPNTPTVNCQSPVSNGLKCTGLFSNVSEVMRILNQLEFQKLFLLLSYIGRKKVEDVMTVGGADDIFHMSHLKMSEFEIEIWKRYGQNCCAYSDRKQLDWDSTKPRFYHCNVNEKGYYYFKGPFLDNTRTHLQRSLGDENVLIVKFEKLSPMHMHQIAREGIFVGLKHYQFFVFKDQRKTGNDNQIEKPERASSVKCYFIHFEDKHYALSGKIIGSVRRRFMHVHTVPTIEKYMARFSLILSRTIKLPVDFSNIQIDTIDDIPFRDEKGDVVCDKAGSILIHTDGTGFISEDLAMLCPKHFTSAEFITAKNFENFQEFAGIDSYQNRGAQARNDEPPLLMQCRLFYNGRAVKGTFLVNKKLAKGTIQVRPSMIKVETDKAYLTDEHFNSLEIVGVSHKPGRCTLSKHLIALLCYGKVPTDFFMKLLNDVLEDSRNIFSKRRAALRVATYNDGLDYGFMAQRMISSGIPLYEPYLQYCLSCLKDDKARLKGGRIPICDSFYLMGTADPTGTLKYDQVCVILDYGQVMGKVLVYRHPGLHFGDIHVMEAVHVKGLEEFVGHSKYGIFFSTKGGKSAAYEMSTGDFDGDLYWVSKNAELLNTYQPEKPWDPDSNVAVVKDSNSRKPAASPDELEEELFSLFLEASEPSFTMGETHLSWHSFMDRLLTLGEGRDSEKEKLKANMNKLINIYYDALDAPKSGKKVNIPNDLIAEQFPHHMEKRSRPIYHSTSILGQIYDAVEAFKDEGGPQELWKIPEFFDISKLQIDHLVAKWRVEYEYYLEEMSRAMRSGPELKDEEANKVIRKYKKVLYEAEEFEESKKNTELIYYEALAIYHVVYERRDIRKCRFAWKVAGTALCCFYSWKLETPKDRPMQILPSVLRELL